MTKYRMCHNYSQDKTENNCAIGISKTQLKTYIQNNVKCSITGDSIEKAPCIKCLKL